MSKVFVLGIDGAPPQFVFDKWIDELPNLKDLMNRGLHARIKTSIPPSTCVAWTSFFSGKDASQFGVYSYTVREGFAYSSSRLVSSKDVRTEMLWDVLKKNGKKSIVLGVPLTYPIEKEIDGCMITGFLTPELDEKSAYPKEFLDEVKEKFPGYLFDVNVGLASYKNTGKDELIEKVYKMTKQSFDMITDSIKNKDWDLLVSVLIGSDRLEHSFWSYLDEGHRYYKNYPKYKDTVKDYFVYVDKQLGKILEMLPIDTTVIVSSDHGMDKMNCRFNLNDWLIKEDYLVLKETPKEPAKLRMSDVDWKKTKAFSVGAYFGRIYFNLEGREPEGIVAIEDYDDLQKEIVEKLRKIPNDKGEKMDNKVYLPQEEYDGEYSEEAPDIMIYFDNLLTGVNNDVGNKDFYSWATTKGSDDAGHAPKGIFVMSGHAVKELGNLGEIDIIDVAPTILSKLKIEKHVGMNGEVIDNG